MNIDNEEQARTLICQCQTDPPRAQLRNLKLAVQSLELSQMYYEQKGNDHGARRSLACITILSERIKELEKA
ncbi:hypothetical protein ACUUL3_14295 [Thiovibrio sp. JS02]